LFRAPAHTSIVRKGTGIDRDGVLFIEIRDPCAVLFKKKRCSAESSMNKVFAPNHEKPVNTGYWESSPPQGLSEEIGESKPPASSEIFMGNLHFIMMINPLRQPCPHSGGGGVCIVHQDHADKKNTSVFFDSPKAS
jgi:hypothetical protein